MFEAGSGSNVTAERNVEVFEEVMFRPRGAVFHSERELATTVLGPVGRFVETVSRRGRGLRAGG